MQEMMASVRPLRSGVKLTSDKSSDSNRGKKQNGGGTEDREEEVSEREDERFHFPLPARNLNPHSSLPLPIEFVSSDDEKS